MIKRLIIRRWSRARSGVLPAVGGLGRRCDPVAGGRRVPSLLPARGTRPRPAGRPLASRDHRRPPALLRSRRRTRRRRARRRRGRRLHRQRRARGRRRAPPLLREPEPEAAGRRRAPAAADLTRHEQRRHAELAASSRARLRRDRRLRAGALAGSVRVPRRHGRRVAHADRGPPPRRTRAAPRCHRAVRLARPHDVEADRAVLGSASLPRVRVPRGLPVGRLVVPRLLRALGVVRDQVPDGADPAGPVAHPRPRHDRRPRLLFGEIGRTRRPAPLLRLDREPGVLRRRRRLAAGRHDVRARGAAGGRRHARLRPARRARRRLRRRGARGAAGCRDRTRRAGHRRSDSRWTHRRAMAPS